MVRAVLNWMKTKRDEKAGGVSSPAQEPVLSGEGESESVCFQGTFGWGHFEMTMAAAQGSIEEARVRIEKARAGIDEDGVSTGEAGAGMEETDMGTEYGELAKYIGLYLSGKNMKEKKY